MNLNPSAPSLFQEWTLQVCGFMVAVGYLFHLLLGRGLPQALALARAVLMHPAQPDFFLTPLYSPALGPGAAPGGGLQPQCLLCERRGGASADWFQLPARL